MKSTCVIRMLYVIGLVIQHSMEFQAHAQASDDFLDGNDDGWIHYDPLAPVGGGATYSFPPVQTPFGLDHRYQIEANPSSNPGLYGSAKAGSFRFDISPGADSVSWVVTGWDTTKSQTFGGFAGVHLESDQTFDGFGFTYSTAGALDILRLDNGVPTVLASTPITLDSASTYRFVFLTSSGSGLTGLLFETPDFVASIARVDVIDPNFVNGASGLYLFSNKGNSGIGATFDNFGVSVIPEPSTPSLLGLAGLIGGWFAFRRRINSR